VPDYRDSRDEPGHDPSGAARVLLLFRLKRLADWYEWRFFPTMRRAQTCTFWSVKRSLTFGADTATLQCGRPRFGDLSMTQVPDWVGHVGLLFMIFMLLAFLGGSLVSAVVLMVVCFGLVALENRYERQG
jgi:hypothetical protein